MSTGSLLQDLGFAIEVEQDIVGFAGGKPVTKVLPIAGQAVSLSLVVLGPTPPSNYQVFTGNALGIIEMAFTDTTEVLAGMPIAIAQKVGNTWYGLTAQLQTPPALATAPPT